MGKTLTQTERRTIVKLVTAEAEKAKAAYADKITKQAKELSKQHEGQAPTKALLKLRDQYFTLVEKARELDHRAAEVRKKVNDLGWVIVNDNLTPYKDYPPEPERDRRWQKIPGSINFKEWKPQSKPMQQLKAEAQATLEAVDRYLEYDLVLDTMFQDGSDVKDLIAAAVSNIQDLLK